MEINKPVSTIIILNIDLILIFLYSMPKYQESRALQAKLDEKMAEYNGKTVYYEEILKTLKEIESNQEAIGKIESALPSTFSFASVVYFLQKKAGENGLVSKSITFSQGVASFSNKAAAAPLKKEVKNITFTMSVMGSYEGLKKFLAALENSSRLFEVNTISFAAGQAQGQSLAKNAVKTYDFRLEIATHTY